MIFTISHIFAIASRSRRFVFAFTHTVGVATTGEYRSYRKELQEIQAMFCLFGSMAYLLNLGAKRRGFGSGAAWITRFLGVKRRELGSRAAQIWEWSGVDK
jgi:23S rRNA A1618 N6-methylase RlmF